VQGGSRKYIDLSRTLFPDARRVCVSCVRPLCSDIFASADIGSKGYLTPRSTRTSPHSTRRSIASSTRCST
jgi:hypothetical protein